MKTALLLSAMLSLLLAGNCFAASPVNTNRSSLNEAESEYVRARKAEADGLLEGARHAYANAVGYALQSSTDENVRRNMTLGGEPLRNVARRALALQKRLLDKEIAAPSGKMAVRSLTGEIQRMYKTMQVLEPENPTWIYLDAVMVANQRNYIKATGLLRRCSNMPSGSPEVKNKARVLMAHIKPAYEQQRAWFDEDLKKLRAAEKEWAKRPVQWVDFSSGNSSYTPSESSGGESSSSAVPSWERQAQNAERNGDYAAADRFRSGSSSMSDGQKYWGN
jgi:hypothetical protein